MTDCELLNVRVVCLREEAPGVIACELRADDGSLPPCPPGAHVDVHLPNGLVRQYSVVSAEPSAYVIGVKRESDSRGGSAYVAESLRIGAGIRIGRPRDNFPLSKDAQRVVLIAGGIGITALIPMARALHAQGRNWTLHYAVRETEDAAFANALREWGGRVHIHASHRAGCRLVISDIVRNESDDAHFYCCGPASMLESFSEATAALPPERVHLERFSAAKPAKNAHEFSVQLKRSGMLVPIAPDQSIVDALLQAGIEAPYSCQQGICGSCEVTVLEGIPDHHDDVLTQAEKESNRTMMICCSRAKSEMLVLDL